MTQPPFVSIVVPCRNEAAHIAGMIDSVLKNEHPCDRLEVLFVDGMSRDGTRDILKEAARRHPFIRILDNPRLTAPAAMNIGIKNARGDVIMRMDAHNEYPANYISRCVELLQATGAGCAGGRIVVVPNGNDGWARAIATVTGHVFGVGNSTFRVGTRPGFVDTVANAAYARGVFRDVGLFDERLTRNQDNEHCARMVHKGYKIAFDPSLRIIYRNQSTVAGLTHQAFYTGMWNAYTLVLHPYSWKTRRFVPAVFALYLAGLAAFLALTGRPDWRAAVAAAPLGLYGGLVAALSASARSAGGGALRVAVTMVVYHLAYGIGTYFGVANLLTGRWRAHLGRPLRP